MTHSATHHSVQPIARSKGRSCVAMAAYRHCKKMTCERTGQTSDYRRKTGLVAEGVIGWRGSVEELWNKAEQNETRVNSRTGREIVIALPKELPINEQERIVKGHCLWMRDNYGVACSYVIHEPEVKPRKKNKSVIGQELPRSPTMHPMITDKEDDEDVSKNPHTHIMITDQEVSDDGQFGKVKNKGRTRLLTGGKTGEIEIEKMRKAWVNRANAALEKAGVAERIDHRSHARRSESGDAPPQEPQRHLGPKMNAIKKRYEKKEKIAQDAKRPPPKAPRFIEEQRRIKRRNAALLGLWHEATKAQKGSSQDGKIRDGGGQDEVEAMQDTADLFSAAFETGSVIARMNQKRKRKEEREAKAVEKQAKLEQEKAAWKQERAEAEAARVAAELSQQERQDPISPTLRKSLIDDGDIKRQHLGQPEASETNPPIRKGQRHADREETIAALFTDENQDQESTNSHRKQEIRRAAQEAAARISDQKAAIKKQAKFNQMKPKGEPR